MRMTATTPNSKRLSVPRLPEVPQTQRGGFWELDERQMSGVGSLYMLFTGWSRKPLDVSARHIRFDDDAPVRRDVTEHAGHAIQPRNLLAIEFLAAVEGNGDPPGIQRQTGSDHLQQVVDASPGARGNQRR